MELTITIEYMVYLITYDLKQPGRDYNKLYEGIKELGEWLHDKELDSVWFVSTNYSDTQILKYLTQYIDSSDRLFITQLHAGEASGYMDVGFFPWINARL